MPVVELVSPGATTRAAARSAIAGGSALSTVIVAGAPEATGMGWLAQSRRLTAVTAIAPVPSPPVDASSTVNSTPPPVAPHDVPRIDSSTVYEPPPLFRTCSTGPGNPASHAPACTLAPGLAGVHSASF